MAFFCELNLKICGPISWGLNSLYKGNYKTLLDRATYIKDVLVRNHTEVKTISGQTILKNLLIDTLDNSDYLSDAEYNSYNEEIDDLITAVINPTSNLASPEKVQSMKIINDEELLFELRVSIQRLDDLYFTALIARSKMLETFRRVVVSALFIDFKNGKFVKNINDYNLNLTNTFNLLAAVMQAYSNLKNGTNNSPILLYTNNGTYIQGSYELLALQAKELFSGFTDTTLNQIQEDINKEENYTALSAYNAWVIINNFDVLAKNLLGKTIRIAPQYSGAFTLFVDANKLKYQISFDSNVVKTWREEELIDALQELGNITTTLIETVPMYKYDAATNTSTLLHGLFLKSKDFAYAITLLKLHKDFQKYWTLFKENPNYYIPLILEEALKKTTTFPSNNNNIKNILYSIYRRFYDLTYRDGEEYSLAQINARDFELTKEVLLRNYLSFITSAIDKMVPINYLEYKLNEDGIIEPEISTTTSISTSSRIIREHIDNINNSISPLRKKQLLNKYKLSHSSKAHAIWLISIPVNTAGIEGTLSFQFINVLGDPKIKNFILKDNRGKTLLLDSDKLEKVIFDSLLPLIDDTLRQQFRHKKSLLLTFIELNDGDEMKSIYRLATLGSRVLIKHYLENKKETNIAKYYGAEGKSTTSFYDSSLKRIRPYVKDNFSRITLQTLALATAIITGDISKLTTRNLKGDSIPKLGLTNMMNSIKSLFRQSKQALFLSKNRQSVTLHSIFAEAPDLLKGFVVKSYTQSADRKGVKSDREFNVGEYGYSAFMLDFLNFYGKKGTFYIQPTVYSDKVTSFLLDIDGNFRFSVDGFTESKPLIEMSPKEILKLHFMRSSLFYTEMCKNIVKDYIEVLDYIVSNDTTNLFNIKNDLAYVKQLPLQLQYKEIVTNIFPKIDDVFDLLLKIKENKIPVDDSLVDKYNSSEFSKYSNGGELYDAVSKILGLTNLVEMHHANKSLKPNRVLSFYFDMFNLKDPSIFNQYMNHCKAKFLRNCLRNFSIDAFIRTTGGEYKLHPIIDAAIKAYAKNQGQSKEWTKKYLEKWIDPNTNELILGKIGVETEDGINYNIIANEENAKTITKHTNVLLNPLLDMFFSIDNLISTQFVINTVGGCYGHKDNFGGDFSDLLDEFDKAEQEEAGRTLTQFKRMVIYPATMHNYSSGILEGIGCYFRTATMRDVPAEVYNLLGDKLKIDAHDGSAFCTYWTAKLLNNSLCNAAAGLDSKPIGGGMYHSYGMGWEYKYALFAMDNERCRVSGGTGINLHNMILKMCSNKWLSDEDIKNGFSLDITKNFLGKQININNITEGGIYYYDPDKKSHYLILNIVKSDNKNNIYDIIVTRVNERGIYLDENGQETFEPIEEIISKPIESNYDLWTAFGAEYSEKKNEDGNLIFGNTSGDAVAYYAVLVGIIRTKESTNNPHMELVPEEIRGELRSKKEFMANIDDAKYFATLTLKDVWQPLKYSDVHYLVNASACKNGQCNVNPLSAWYSKYNPEDKNTYLNTVIISNTHMGLLMDADHHADNSKVTEMSLVMSSLEENGHTHEIAKSVYKDLGNIIRATLHKEIDALVKLYEGKTSKSTIYKIVYDAFTKEFFKGSRSSSTLALSILYNILNLLAEATGEEAENIHIPFSDNNILGIAISTITAGINNSAIRRKYPGIASILIPAYDIYKIYNINGIDYTKSDIIRKGINLDLEQLKLELNTPPLRGEELSLGKSYILIDEFGERKRITLSNISEYEKARNSDYYFYEDLNAGRNLLGFNCEFEIEQTIDGKVETKKFSIYDMDEVKDKLNFAEKIHQLLEDIKTAEKNNSPLEFNKIRLDLYRNFLSSIRTIRRDRKFESPFSFKALSNKKEAIQIINDTDVSLTGKIFEYATKASVANEDEEYWMVDKYIQFIDNILKNNMVEALRVLEDENEVTFNDKVYNVKNLKKSAAEIILPKVFATIFGLKEGDSLNNINESYFEKLLTKNLSSGSIGIPGWDIVLKRGNGNHTFLVLDENDLPKGAQPVEVSTVYDMSTGKLMRVGEDNEIVGPFEKCKLYIYNGIEYIVTSDPELFFKYENNYDDVDVNWNKANIRDTLSLVLSYNYDIINDLRNEVEKKVKNTKDEDDLYNKYDLTDLKSTDLLKMLENLLTAFTEKVKSLSKFKFTSFLKSLEFTAARVPSLAMLSFMSMKVAAFTDSPDNKAYVSHFQTYLLGSDYDIDKVFLLGFEFDKNGKFIGWSPLFDLYSKKTLEASEKIPMPDGRKITIEKADPNNLEGISIQPFIESILEAKYERSKTEEETRINTINSYIDLINFITENTSSYFTYNEEELNYLLTRTSGLTIEKMRKDIKNIINKIDQHNLFIERTSTEKGIRMMKNSASSKIRRVIDSLVNAVAATTPVEMSLPKLAASLSALGKAEREYTLCDPAIKWLIKNQNMVGKKSIGITAVGQKALFALLYYYNEALRSGDIKWQERACFEKNFELSADIKTHKKIPMIFNIISNVNFRGFEDDSSWKNIITQNANRLLHVEDPKLRNYLADIILQLLILTLDVALVNSLLISAATDNAKELLLVKLNATPDLLKVYVYGIVLGIEFNQLADLMISPTVLLIIDLAQNNVFLTYNPINSIKSAITAIILGLDIPNIRSSAPREQRSALAGSLEILRKGDRKLTKFTGNHKFLFSLVRAGKISQKDFMDEMYLRLSIVNKTLLDTYKTKDYTRASVFKFLKKYYLILSAIENMDHSEFMTFRSLLECGEEFTTLGKNLSVNLGLSTGLAEKMDFLVSLEETFLNRVSKLSSKNNKGIDPNVVLLLNPLIAYYHEDPKLYILEVIDRGRRLGILGRTVDDADIDILRFIRDDRYAEAVIDIYDLCKSSLNIFAIIKKSPHFSLMFTAAWVDMELARRISARVELTYSISRVLKKNQFKYLDSKKSELLNNNISNFILDIIISKYFSQLPLNLSIIYANTQVYDLKGNLSSEIELDAKINLATSDGQATFKHWVDNVVIPRLLEGYNSDTSTTIDTNLSENRFISDLVCMSSTFTLLGFPKYMQTLPIKMDSKNLEEDPVYILYLNEFNKLFNLTYNNIPIPLILFYYNLITNKNRPGEHSLTPIFKSLLKKNKGNNYIFDYFKYVGELDFNGDLSTDDFSMKDLYIACAVQMSRNEVTQNTKYPYIKIWNHTKNSWNIYKYSPMSQDDISGDEEMNTGRIQNYMPFVLGSMTQITNFMNDFPNVHFAYTKAKVTLELSLRLKDLFENGKLLIYMNCE